MPHQQSGCLCHLWWWLAVAVPHFSTSNYIHFFLRVLYANAYCVELSGNNRIIKWKIQVQQPRHCKLQQCFFSPFSSNVSCPNSEWHYLFVARAIWAALLRTLLAMERQTDRQTEIDELNIKMWANNNNCFDLLCNTVVCSVAVLCRIFFVWILFGLWFQIWLKSMFLFSRLNIADRISKVYFQHIHKK